MRPDTSAGPTAFGRALALDGDLLVVGAPFTGGIATFPGAVYVFRTPDGGRSWVQEAELLAPQDSLGLGRAIAVDAAAGRIAAGSIEGIFVYDYVPERTGGAAWVPAAHLVPDSGLVNHRIDKLALDGDELVAGVPLGGAQGFPGEGAWGTAFVFRRTDGAWAEVTQLLSSTPDYQGHFGTAVALDGRSLLVGETHSEGGGSGRVFAYRRSDEGVWEEEARLFAPVPRWDEFGWAVALEGTRALIGAIGQDTHAPLSGAAYLYQREEPGTWALEAELVPDGLETYDAYGWSASLRGDFALVSATEDEVNGARVGSAYVFGRDESGAWSEAAFLVAPEIAPNTGFGWSVSLSGEAVAIGMPWDSGSWGAVYVAPLAVLVSAEEEPPVPEDARLSVYPNPFRERATVTFTLGAPGPVRLAVYDVLGRLVATLADGSFPAGTHRVPVAVASVPAGAYLLRIEAQGTVSTYPVSRLR